MSFAECEFSETHILKDGVPLDSFFDLKERVKGLCVPGWVGVERALPEARHAGGGSTAEKTTRMSSTRASTAAADARRRGSGRHRARARPVTPFLETSARARGGGGPRRASAPRHARPPAS